MQFDLDFLLIPALVIFFSTYGISFIVTRSIAFSFFAATLKSGTFFIYFSLLFDGTFTFLDDWCYLEIGQTLYENNIGITNLIENLDFVQMLNGGSHYLYSLYNVYSFQLFGIGYYAPVALNILLTLLIAWFGANLANIEFGFNCIWKNIFFTFLLFHPDIFAWSNVMNGKDTLVLLFHILLLYSVSMYYRRQLLASLGLALFAFFILSGIRFYVPFLFSTAFLLSLLLARKNRNILWKLFIALVGLASVPILKSFNLQDNLEVINESFINPFYGFFHFILTPIPFGTDSEYAFLDIPALIHWSLIPFAVKGFFIILKSPSDYQRFFLVYLLIFVSLYAVSGELQGPRQRIQLDFAWAVLQFMGLKHVYYLFYQPSYSRLNNRYLRVSFASKSDEK